MRIRNKNKIEDNLTPIQPHITNQTPVFSHYNSFWNVLSNIYTYRTQIFYGAILLSTGLISVGRLFQANQPAITVRFDLIGGNLTHANRVFIGENHNFRSYVGDEVDRRTQHVDKHVIRLEGVPDNIEVDCIKHGFRNMTDRKCVGWEDPDDLLDKLKGSFREERNGIIFRQLKRLYDSNKKPQELDKILKEKLNFVKQEAKNLLKLAGLNDFSDLLTQYTPNEFVALSAYQDYLYLKKLVSLREKSHSYKTIIAQDKKYLTSHFSHKELEEMENLDCKNIFSQKARAEFKIDMLNRNKKMLRQYPGFFSVTISGKSHVEPTTLPDKCEDLDLTESAEYVQKELEKGKDQNPYAILAMRIGR